MGFFARRRARKKAKEQARGEFQGKDKDQADSENAGEKLEKTSEQPQAEEAPASQKDRQALKHPSPDKEQEKDSSMLLPAQDEKAPEPGPGPDAEAVSSRQALSCEPAPRAETDKPEKKTDSSAQEQAEEKDSIELLEAEKKQGFLKRLSSRLGKTRDKISGSIDKITLGRKIDDELLDELEEVLITADMGMPTTLKLMDSLRGKVKRSELADVEALKNALAKGIEDVLAAPVPAPERTNTPHVILVVGVNGVGKTTSIGKLAHYFTSQGKKVLLAAGDTFRAAAAEQLEVWAERADCPIVRQKHGADPSAVAYDAIEAALSRGRDLVLIDTAGRLHTKVNLMDELKKIHRVIQKRLPGAPHEVLLVLDATTGQNALSQAKLFNQAVPLTGLVLTKLDGTAKGGIVVSISSEMQTPVCFVGIGEGIDDLRPFAPSDFAKAIF
jgi:fused signal recognition particle receptor